MSSPPLAHVEHPAVPNRQSMSPPVTPASPFELRHAVIGRKEGARIVASDVVRQAQPVTTQSSATNTGQGTRSLPPGASYNAPSESPDQPWINMEGSMRELTRRASAENEQLEADARQDGINTGMAAGLASPFRSAGRSTSEGCTGGPPVAGNTRFGTLRQRTTSGNSAYSLNASTLSKDQLLRDLADAVKSERRRNTLYEEEILSAETEIDYLVRETTNVEHKYAERIVNQDGEIGELRKELEQIKQELETAYDLDPEIAQDMLELLSKRPLTQSPSTLIASSPAHHAPAPKSIIESFDIDALRGSKPSNATIAEPAHRTRKISKAKRRIDAHVAAHKSDLETIPPKPSLWTRTRRLSRSLSQSKSNTPAASTPTNDSAESKTVSFAAPLDETKITNAISSSSEEVSSVLPYKPSIKSSKPPIAGQTLRHREKSSTAGQRPRSRSDSFKRGLATTLRVMFPSSPSAADGQASRPIEGEKIRTWLGETRGGQSGRSDRVGDLYADPFRH
ncbi:hypothetical protein OIV83_002720 [Microbotryomycetes sp. JL201]|nr:hypothetical protein OIV83_002720 [Microbotryomycetes sp. JL201]